jgi:histidinol-phosphatase (PHP family)
MIGNGPAMADYHVHPDFSIDATGSVDDFCQAALKKGLVEICFTTHYDSNPGAPEGERRIRIDGKSEPLTFDAIGKYVAAVAEAHERYFARGLEVKCGIEVGFYPGCEKHIADLFRRFPFQYKLAAIHEIEDICLCCQDRFEACFSRYSCENMADKYFGLAKEAAISGLFDSIAHIDVYKKYGLKYYGDSILVVHRGRIEPVFDLMAKNNVGMEINTAALRRGHDEYYPSMEILNLARNFGVNVSAIGSDAHSPEEVAYDFEAAAAIAYELFPYCDE